MNWKDVCKNQCGSIVGITDDADNQIAGLFRTALAAEKRNHCSWKISSPLFREHRSDEHIESASPSDMSGHRVGSRSQKMTLARLEFLGGADVISAGSIPGIAIP